MNEALLEKVRKGAELCRYDPDPGQECKMLGIWRREQEAR